MARYEYEETGLRGGGAHAGSSAFAARQDATQDDPIEGGGGLPEVAFLILGHVAASTQGLHGYRLGRLLSRPPLRVPGLRISRLYRTLRRLEREGFVVSRVEPDSPRLRYRFVVTPKGEAALRQWLTAMPSDSGALCQDLLNRLRFAALLSPAGHRQLVDAAAEECGQALAALGSDHGDGDDGDAYTRALRARLATDRCWIEEVRGLLGRPSQSGRGPAKTSA